MDKLAIHGGIPAIDHLVGYGHQDIDESDIRAVVDVLKSDFLTCGPATVRFEDALRDITGARYVTAVANGTAALHVACLAAGIGPGDEVIVSPITFAASANCVLYCGGTPVFADIDPDTWNVSPEAIEAAVTERTRAVVAVDFGGVPINAAAIRSICDRHGLTFIEDAAHAVGTLHADGSPVGSVADLTCLSFHPVKTITTGEGGAVCTSDSRLAKAVELYAKHGITRRPEWLHEPDIGGWWYEQQVLGYNYRISDIEAALGESQLRRLTKFAERRREIVRRYNEAFADVPAVSFQLDTHPTSTVRHLYCIRFDLTALGTTHRWVFDALRAEGVGTNVHYIPVYRLPYYAEHGYDPECCPEANQYYEEAVTLPLHCNLNDDEIEGSILAVRKVIEWCLAH